MFTCNKCGIPFSYHHACSGFITVRLPIEAANDAEQEPIFGNNGETTLWNVRQIRKELAELRAELSNRGPVRAFAAHWAEHD